MHETNIPIDGEDVVDFVFGPGHGLVRVLLQNLELGRIAAHITWKAFRRPTNGKSERNKTRIERRMQ